MKICINCNKEFDQKTNRGIAQKYCSTNCRMKSYIDRKKIKANEELNELRIKASNNMGLPNSNNIQTRFNPPGEVDRANLNHFSHNPIEQLEKTYEAKTEALKWQMKYDSIAKEVEELKNKNNFLTMQLETMDDDEPEESGNFLAGVVKNPQPFIMGVNLLIDKGFEIYEKLDKKRKVQSTIL